MSRAPILAVVAALAAPAVASESVLFTYDALGGLTQSVTAGGANNGMQQSWLLDPAGNRVTLTMTGSANRGRPDAPVIVLPIDGFTILPIELR